ncbi:MAG: hypothetical protein HY724_01405 [Candidatus Rokubacteria bacterium]|nr:hypothetical protein [Candidatus Rokubacteria bacterium]
MDQSKVKALTQEILALPDPERQQLAEEVLPVLLTTRPGLAGIDQALQALSDQELDALIERARSGGRDLPDSTVAAVIGEALRAVRAQM